jgi:hypothetical protein
MTARRALADNDIIWRRTAQEDDPVKRRIAGSNVISKRQLPFAPKQATQVADTSQISVMVLCIQQE